MAGTHPGWRGRWRRGCRCGVCARWPEAFSADTGEQGSLRRYCCRGCRCAAHWDWFFQLFLGRSWLSKRCRVARWPYFLWLVGVVASDSSCRSWRFRLFWHNDPLTDSRSRHRVGRRGHLYSSETFSTSGSFSTHSPSRFVTPGLLRLAQLDRYTTLVVVAVRAVAVVVVAVATFAAMALLVVAVAAAVAVAGAPFSCRCC